MRAIPLAFIAGFGLLVAACASLSPEEEARHTLFWETAKNCESRYRTIRLRHVDPDGKVYFYDYAQAEVPEFLTCYQEGVREKVVALARVASGRLSLPAGDTPTTSVPIRIVGGMSLVPAAINESRVATLLLDTGASNTVISPALANELKIVVPKNAPQKMFVGVGGKSFWAPFARIQSLKVGAFAVEDLDVVVFDAFPSARGVDGLLGADFLGRFAVTVDSTSQVLTLELAQPTPSSDEPRAEEPGNKEAVASEPEKPPQSPASPPTQRIPPPAQRTRPGDTNPLVWKPGYEWSFRWESPRGKGALVWVVTAETEVNGLPSYVIKSGSREIAYAKGDDKLGWHVEKVGGVLVERAVPPAFYFTWPLRVGKSWEYTYAWEGIRARQTEERTRRCTVEAMESITVPAGTFQTFRVACTNQLGQPTHTYWFSEAVKMFVKDRSYYSYGVRDRELTGYKLD